jgi:uncharacterized protein YfaS (alpha-2-macroglobulin family)
MSGLPRAALASFLLLVLAWVLPGVSGAAPPGTGRTLVLSEGTDYFGKDLQVLKGVELEACKSACLADGRCAAFTYNVKSRWCFLKTEFSQARAFPGAVSGRIVQGSAPGPDLQELRLAELSFVPAQTMRAAQKLAKSLVAKASAPGLASLSSLVTNARTARAMGNGQLAATLYASALRLAPDEQGLWAGLADATLAARPRGWQEQQQAREAAVAAAVAAYLHAATTSHRAGALDLLSRALAGRELRLPAIRAARASLALVADPRVQRAYDNLVAKYGFRVVDHSVDAEVANPRICVQVSMPLATGRQNLADFVSVEGGPGLSVEPEERQLCVDGVVHGGRYQIHVRKGLPAANGETLAKTVDLEVYVRDRSPMVHFIGHAYVLPKGGEASLPIVSVNTDRIAATVYRIGDRALVRSLGDGPFLKQLTGSEAKEIADQTGERVWRGTIEVQRQLNREVTTAVPVGAMIKDLEPGTYVMTAQPASKAPANPDEGCEDSCYESQATQWFVVSDIGLATLSGNDGLHVIARSLATAKPLPGLELRLIARNDEVLGRARTDDQGLATLAPGLMRGTGGNTPTLLVAEAQDGDYGFLDLTKSPFDLSDRGVSGRPPAKPLDVYLVAERGVYRPGETVHLTALVRNPRAEAVAELPLTLIVKRPDGVERTRIASQDKGQGGHQVDLHLTRGAMRGTWHVHAYADVKGQELAQTSFLVEDFVPERLDFDLKSQTKAIDPASPPALNLSARFLYGAPAGGLGIEGETQVKATDSLADYPGFHFGLADESPEPVSAPLPGAKTDAAGKAEVQIALPDLPKTSEPLTADVTVRVVDTGGRPVERSLTLPLAATQGRLGIKPLFEGSAPEGGTAAFEVIVLGPDGQRVAQSGLTWSLLKVREDYQWYRQDNGSWDYEPIESTERVASGTLDAGLAEVGRIGAHVGWGGYRLQISAPGGEILPASLSFEAGWYVKPTGADTPDVLKVSLDKPTYRVGETAQVRLEPRFAGIALVMVVDDRLVGMKAVAVPAAGTTLRLPVTADWGPGAYVTAVLYRPMDLAAKRMPGRAIGLTWAGVDPGKRRLRPVLEVPAQVRPRGPLTVRIDLGPGGAGSETSVTLAAVDLGILSLTRYIPPDPDGWYFGQRRLGMEIRDLYGQLIDRMQGAPGVVRSGGDAGLGRFQGPPPAEQPLALFSGVVHLDAAGKGSVTFDLPDFNGTVRLMAMAWSAQGVGHAVKDVIVRDPVVMTASLPRFLAPGDRSRLLLDLANMEAPAGTMSLEVASGHGLVHIDPAAAKRSLTLAQGARTQVSVPLAAEAIGDETLTLTLTTPDGLVLTKHLTLGVRANGPPVLRTSATTLAPRVGALVLSPDLMQGLVPDSGTALVSISGAGRLDVAGIVRALDRYPYGCTEQLTSRALPLLYLDPVALAAGLSGDEAVPQRIRDALVRILSNQGSNGSFGLWSPGGDDLWLDAFVTDLLTRARERGYAVPDVAYNLALENLRNRVAYDSPGDAMAYVVYDLARNSRANIGDLRYLADTGRDKLTTPIAKAQLAAALAQLGDRQRADTLFRAALAAVPTSSDTGWRLDYGSALRDAAAVLALAAESGSEALDLQGLAGRVEDLREQRRYLSTQEDAWLLLAANALIKQGAQLKLALDDTQLTGALYRSFDAAALTAHPVVVRNRGDRPVYAQVTVTGVPLEPPPAGAAGYSIERAYYDLHGARVDLAAVPQGTRLVAVLSVRADQSRAARLIVNDPLPAGFEIDNPSVMKAGDIAAIPWLSVVDAPAHEEFRDDRFIAAVDRAAGDTKGFQLAYMIRAVSPGSYTHPAALVEEMYRPELRGWTDQGKAEILPPAGP